MEYNKRKLVTKQGAASYTAIKMTHISVRFPSDLDKIKTMDKFKKIAKKNKTTANKLIITFIKNYK